MRRQGDGQASARPELENSQDPKRTQPRPKANKDANLSLNPISPVAYPCCKAFGKRQCDDVISLAELLARRLLGRLPHAGSSQVLLDLRRKAVGRNGARCLSAEVEASQESVVRRQMTALTVEQQAMVALFQRHVEAELAGDLDATMATMTDDPHLNHVPTMAGGVGRRGVQAFYRDHLVGRFFPPDVTMTNLSRTGQDQVVDEIAINFTHTQQIDWLLPGVPATGKHVEMAVAVIVGFRDGKISHEHTPMAAAMAKLRLFRPISSTA
jgi:carboxymethylenebutenolidase